MAKDKSEKKEKKEKKSKETTVQGDEDVEMVDTDLVKVRLLMSTQFITTHRRGQGERKAKKEREEIVTPLEDLSPIAHPLAQKKLLKKLHKTVKRGRHTGH